MRLFPTCLLLAGLPLHPLLAQQVPSAARPDAVALVFVTALKAEDWSGASRLIDPGELAELATVFREVARMPGAEDQMRQLLNLSKDEHPLTLTPEEYMARLLAAASRQQADTWSAVKSAQYSVLGTVTEGKDQAHVVIRANVAVVSIPLTTVEVRSLRRTEAGWRLQFPAELRGLVAGFKAALSENQ